MFGVIFSLKTLEKVFVLYESCLLKKLGETNMKLIFESNGKQPVFVEKKYIDNAGKSKKNKQTLVLGIDNVDVDYHDFSDCNVTPLVVLYIDGKKIQTDSRFFSPTLFANPIANKIALDFKKNEEMVGRYWANMVIRYKSKNSNDYVLTVCPDGSTLQRDGKTLQEALGELSHAGRRDAKFQIDVRKAMIADFLAKQK